MYNKFYIVKRCIGLYNNGGKMESGKLIAFRPKTDKTDVTPHLEALKAAGIGKNDSDRLRMAVVAFTKQKRLKVSA